MLVRTHKIDPKDYPFKAHIDAQKHLDTDELRHKIKPIETHIPTHHAGKEHQYCDKDQLDTNGKWKDDHAPAKARGFKTMREMWDADKKAEEDKKKKETDDAAKTISDLTQQVSNLTSLVQQLLAANGNNGKK